MLAGSRRHDGGVECIDEATGGPAEIFAAALKDRETPLRVIFENIADVVYLLDVEADGYRFVAVNPRFLAATGLALDQVIGRRVDGDAAAAAAPWRRNGRANAATISAMAAARRSSSAQWRMRRRRTD